MPGVRGVTYGMEAPFEWVGGNICCWGTSFQIQDVEDTELGARVHAVEEGFFDTYEIPLLAGGVWPASESPPTPIPVVMAEALAVRIFGAPEMVPTGRAARSASQQSSPSRTTPVTVEEMCMTWL